jgi:DinB superfamily
VLDYASDLETTVRRVVALYSRASDLDAARRPAPGKWSAKEIIGHLIDSASNNHGRFVRANCQDDLIFAGYDQDNWVAVQQYNEAPWGLLLELWLTFNLHIARVMDAMPASIRMREHTRHNLDEVAFQAVSKNESVTLDFFMRDYVMHLHHHLRQLDALAIPIGDAPPIPEV